MDPPHEHTTNQRLHYRTINLKIGNLVEGECLDMTNVVQDNIIELPYIFPASPRTRQL